MGLKEVLAKPRLLQLVRDAETCRRAEGYPASLADRQAGRQRQRPETETEADIQTDRQINTRQRTHAHTHTHTFICPVIDVAANLCMYPSFVATRFDINIFFTAYVSSQPDSLHK